MSPQPATSSASASAAAGPRAPGDDRTTVWDTALPAQTSTISPHGDHQPRRAPLRTDVATVRDGLDSRS